MFIDINKIEGDGIRFDTDLAIPALDAGAGETLPVAGAHLRGRVFRGERGIEIVALLRASVEMSCSRCLEPVRLEIATDLARIVLRASGVPEVETGEDEEDDAGLEESAVRADAEGRVSLVDVAREQVYLQLPLKPMCSPGCKGLCPRCGTNRNAAPCDCGETVVDPRLAPLMGLKR